MGLLEHLIVTPSHHRVHHAINEEYLDKNYSQIFIIWDKLFGTFQEEQKAIPPVYGITRPMRTWNPIKINFVHMWLLIKDAWRAKRWMDKIHVWTKPTGWRPAEVDEKYPVFKIEDVYNFEKYSFKRTPLFIVWIWAQIGILFLITSYLLSHITTIGIPNMFFYGGFIFIYVYALTDLMDGNASAVFWEILKACYGITILFAIGDWYGLETVYSHSNTIVIAYFILSILMTLYLGKQREKQFELQH